MKYLLLLLLTGCSVQMTTAGSHVRIVSYDNADFVNECEFIRAIEQSNMTGWDYDHSARNAANEMRNQAANLGGNVLVVTDGGHYASADVYRCP